MIPRSPHLSLDSLWRRTDHGQMRQAVVIALCVLFLPVAAFHVGNQSGRDGRVTGEADGEIPVEPVIDIALLEMDLGFTWIPAVTLRPRSAGRAQTSLAAPHRNPARGHTGSTADSQSDSHPATTAARCRQWEPLLATASQKWDVVRMSEIMWRESRCLPEAQSPHFDTGLLQINQINHEYLSAHLGVTVNADSLTDPALNIAAAAVLCEFWEERLTTDCYQPWVTTDLGPK
jgi:hypothetical protein